MSSSISSTSSSATSSRVGPLQAQLSQRDQWLQSGNGFAVLSDLPEQEDGNSKVINETVKVVGKQSGKKVGSNKGLHRQGYNGQTSLPHRVSLGHFLPEDLMRASKRRTGAEHRCCRQEEASQRPPKHTMSGAS